MDSKLAERRNLEIHEQMLDEIANNREKDYGTAAYMGHQKYSSTAWYVHLLPERLAATGLTRAAGIIPAVTS